MYSYHNRGTRPCRYGTECRFLRQGNCWFYHPQSHSNPTVNIGRTARVTRRSIRDYDSDEDIFIHQDPSDNDDDDFMGLFGLRSNNTRSYASRISRPTQTRQRIQPRQSSQSSILQLNRLLLGLYSFKKKQQTIPPKQEEIKITMQNKLKRVNGKIISCGNIKSNLPTQKKWYFENANHFKFVKECGYQQCSICLDKFQSGQVTTELLCKHAFHTDCIHKWLKTSDNCPLCRKNFKEHADYKNMNGYPKKFLNLFSSFRLTSFRDFE